MPDSRFWNKKIVVSYLLSIEVFWIHCSSFVNYDYSNSFVRFCSDLFGKTINNMAVPLFFILSGMAFYRDYTGKNYLQKLRRRIKSLVIPFLLWNTINMLFQILVSTFFSQFFVGREKIEITLSNVLLGIFHYEYNRPFWFVFALIIFAIAAPVIDQLLRSEVTAVISVIALTLLYKFRIGLPRPFFFSQTCIIFYLVGGYIGRFHFGLFSKSPSKKYQLLSACVIALAVGYYMLVNYEIIAQERIGSVVLPIVLSVCFWNMLDLFLPTGGIAVPEFMKHSFWIFALHMNVSAVITKLLFLVLPKNPYMSLVNFGMTTLATLLFIEIGCFLVKKTMPSAYALLSGSR